MSWFVFERVKSVTYNNHSHQVKISLKRNENHSKAREITPKWLEKDSQKIEITPTEYISPFWKLTEVQLFGFELSLP